MRSFSSSRTTIFIHSHKLPKCLQNGLATMLIIMLIGAIYYVRKKDNGLGDSHDQLAQLDLWKVRDLTRNSRIARKLGTMDIRSIDSDGKPKMSLSEMMQVRARLLQEAMVIKSKGYYFRILIYAWKRRASLKRLLDSLLMANYMGFTVHLDFHLDGGAHPAVIEFIEKIEWPHGRKRINRHGDRVGLERTIMSSWPASDDKEFALLFEDDIEVSDRYFEYCLLTLHKYIIPFGKRAPPSAWTDRLMGISLNTPRYNEIVFPGEDWTPIQVIGTDEPQFLFQLPCSWGALYFPWKWRQFLQYYNWRSIQVNEELDYLIPDSATRFWRRSWKKFLIELMYMRGEFMLYPSLDHQVSLSTHHREPGEHTDLNPEEPLVDDLTTLVLYYFTVPLIRNVDEDEYLRLVSSIKPLYEMPVVSFHHDKVPNPYSLLQIGWTAKSFIEGVGWYGEHRSSCLLNDLSHPINQATKGERYLLYIPQMGMEQQIFAFQAAIAHAHVLNRTLVIPHLVNRDNSIVPLHSLVQFDGLDRYIKTITMDSFLEMANQNHIHRIVYNLPWNMRKESVLSNLNDTYLNNLGIYPEMDVIMHAFPINETEIRKAYDTCQDQTLAYKHLYGSFSSFEDFQVDKQFKEWLSSTVQWSPLVQKLSKHLLDPKHTTVCGLFSRAECGPSLENRMQSDEEGRLIMFRSCKVSLERTIEYVLEDSQTLKINPTTVYMINEVDSNWTVQLAKKNVKVLSRQDIVKLIHADPELDKFTDATIESLADMIEFETCAGAAFFLGNQFSLASKEIILARERLPSNTLGKKINLTK